MVVDHYVVAASVIQGTFHKLHQLHLEKGVIELGEFRTSHGFIQESGCFYTGIL